MRPVTIRAFSEDGSVIRSLERLLFIFDLCPNVAFVIDEWWLNCEGQISENRIPDLGGHLNHFRLNHLLQLRLVEDVSALSAEETLSALMPNTIPPEVEANLRFGALS